MSQGWRAVGLVARREVVARGLSRATLVTTAVVVLLVVVGLVVTGLRGGDDREQVGLLGGGPAEVQALEAYAASAGLALDVLPVERGEVQDRVRDDLLAVVELDSGPRVRAIPEVELDPQLEAVLTGFTQQRAAALFLAREGVDPAGLAAATSQAELDVTALDPPEAGSDERTALAYATVFVLYGQLLLFGVYVAMGVVEEKSTRVVEVVLAAIRPLHLLAGKVLGLGVVALAQLLVVSGAALATALATDQLELPRTALSVLATALLWFVLGYLLLSVLNAAAASLVSRQEDVSAVTTPVNLLVVVMFLVAQSAVFGPGSRLTDVLSFVPPFSAILMPLRVAKGDVGAAEVALAVLLSLLVTAAVTLLAARVYERSVLRTGSRVRLRDVLRSSTSAA